MANVSPLLSAVQMCSVPDIGENLAFITKQLAEITAQSESREHLVLLPECCLYFGGKEQDQLSIAHNDQAQATMIEGLASLAKTYSVNLLAGSLPTPALGSDRDKFYNTSCLFSPKGELIGDYQKLHLFDVVVADNEKNYQESRYTQAGQKIRCVSLPFAQIGLSICYDIRFPELFRQLAQQGADVITVPAAFTRVTGKAHWQTLLQARAIENQVYIVAAGQEGVHANGRETWGHSMIISPWGEILHQQATGLGVVSAEFDPNILAQVRSSIPVNQHNRFKTELIHDE